MRTHLLASVGLCIPLHSFFFFLFLFQQLNFTGFRKILKKHDKVKKILVNPNFLPYAVYCKNKELL